MHAVDGQVEEALLEAGEAFPRLQRRDKEMPEQDACTPVFYMIPSHHVALSSHTYNIF